LGLRNRINDDSPCGIAFRANNSILAEEKFHRAKYAKEEDQESFLCGLGVPSAEFILTKEELRTGLAR